ncbi:MAG: hypothetical protein Q9160_002520 [Pyrenula sp. 1 TL-2023]
MRRLVHILGRWNPLTRSPSVTTTQLRCLQTSPPLQARKKRPQEQKDIPFTVREFEQAGPNGKRIEVDENAGLKDEERLLQIKVRQLEDELRIMREGPFGPNSELMMALPPQEREIALNALAEHKKKFPNSLDDNFGDPELEKMLEKEAGLGTEEYEDGTEDTPQPGAPPARVQFQLKQEYKVLIKGLNRTLAMVAEDKDNREHGAEMWKWYLRCKRFIPHFTSQIEQDIWDLIWESQLQVSECSGHLKTVAEDILACGKELQDQQWLLYIDSLHVLGLTGSAIERWHEARFEGTSDLQRSPNFWRLGAQLLADTDQPLQAERIASEAIDGSQGKNHRALMPVISAWARSSATFSHQKAWTCYLKVKAGLGKQMTMDDYDEISTSLLTAHKPDLALAVFKDMLLADENSVHDSTALFKAAAGYVDEVRASSITEKQVNGISLAALTVLPRKYQNRYFYGSWIKKLIGLGEIDAAGAVVELMYERGVRPDTKHINGILGGWLRDETPTSWERAERMGWAMIEKRIEYVDLRRHASYREVEAALSKSPAGVLIPSFVRRMVPRANLETFSILLLHYVRRSNVNAAQRLTKHLSHAEIAPSAFYYNQLLFLYRSTEDIDALWGCYTEMRDKDLPDLETFACLWDAANLRASNKPAFKSSTFPHLWDLFREMQGWITTRSEQSQRMIISQFPQAMYRQIIVCFASTRGLMGMLLALHGMKELFDFYPDDQITAVVTHQITRFLPREPRTQTQRGRKSRLQTMKKAGVARIQKVTGEIETRRSLRLMNEGMDPLQLAEESPGPKQLEILTELIVGVLQRTTAEETVDIPQWIDKSAQSMGIVAPDIAHLTSKDNTMESLS